MEERNLKPEAAVETSRPNDFTKDNPRDNSMTSESISPTTRGSSRATGSRHRETTRDLVRTQPVLAEKTRNGVNREVFDYDIPITNKPGLEGFLELIGKRINGDYHIDEFGCDPLYAQMWWPLFEQLYRNYWRVDTTGIGNVPESGRAMVVANHSGGSYAWDAVMMSCVCSSAIWWSEFFPKASRDFSSPMTNAIGYSASDAAASCSSRSRPARRSFPSQW